MPLNSQERDPKDLEASDDRAEAPLLPGPHRKAVTSPQLNQVPSQRHDDRLGGDRSNPGSQRKAFLLASIVLLAVACVEFGIALPTLFSSSTAFHFPGLRHYPRFLVIGDWGRQGRENQTVVADAMAQKAKSFRPDFIVSTGDNFYETGLVSYDDPAFDLSFRNVYNHSELQVPWLVALGNHDYGEASSNDKPDCTKASKSSGECYFGPSHQLDIRLVRRDPRWHCERTFSKTYADGAVEIFFIDTTPIISSYADESWATNRGGVLQQSWEDQVRELEARLARSQADWKLVVGHHPIRTNHRSDLMYVDMVDRVEPLLIKYGVQLYMCGHDHNLQYIYNPERGYHQITSGAGSQIGSGFYGDKDSPFQYAANGFVTVAVGRNSLRVEYLGVDTNQPLFVVDVPRHVNYA